VEECGPTFRPRVFRSIFTGLTRPAAADRARPCGIGDAPDINAFSERMRTIDECHDMGWALPREDMAKREIRSLIAVAGMIGLAVALLMFPIRLPV